VFRSDFNNVSSIKVTPPEFLDYQGSWWQAGKIVVKFNDDTPDVEIPYSTAHFKSREEVPVINIAADNTSVRMAEELDMMRHKVAVALEVLND